MTDAAKALIAMIGRFDPRVRAGIAAVFAALLLASPIVASPEPDFTVDVAVAPGGRGLNIHRLQNPAAEFDRIAAAGFRIVRIDLTWSSIETSPGVYDWSYPDRLVDQMTHRGIRPLLILAYANPVYGAEASSFATDRTEPAPVLPRARDAFARWSAAVATHYRAANPILEIWNEPNHDRFWLPQSSPDAYVALAARACRAIRAVTPQATVIGPAFGNSPPLLPASTYVDAVVGSPAGACFSAISVHPYLYMGAIDGGVNWWRAVKAHLATVAGHSVPLANSESGISTYGGRLSDLDQAAYAVRMFVQDSASGVPISIWYDWRDDGADPANPEHHFGLTTLAGRPKQVYTAITTLSAATRTASRVCFMSLGGARRAFFYDGTSRSRVVIAWDATFRGRSIGADRQPIEVALPSGAQVDGVTDMLATPISSKGVGQAIRLSSGRPPFVVRYTGPLPSTCAKAA